LGSVCRDEAERKQQEEIHLNGSVLSDRVHTELWTSWASLLRSYAAAHGLNSVQHAVVEVSANEIILRVGDRWVRFRAAEMQHSGKAPVPFALTEDGNVRIGAGAAEEMDMAAERVAREMLHAAR
jgi:hypothetical protein